MHFADQICVFIVSYMDNKKMTFPVKVFTELVLRQQLQKFCSCFTDNTLRQGHSRMCHWKNLSARVTNPLLCVHLKHFCGRDSHHAQATNRLQCFLLLRSTDGTWRSILESTFQGECQRRVNPSILARFFTSQRGHVRRTTSLWQLDFTWSSATISHLLSTDMISYH